MLLSLNFGYRLPAIGFRPKADSRLPTADCRQPARHSSYKSLAKLAKMGQNVMGISS
jgi:hypothetical protein